MTTFTILSQLLFCITIQTSFTQSAHVLLMPVPFKSVVYEYSTIGYGLLERGHRVTILLSDSYPELENVRSKSGFHVVTYQVTHADFNSPEADSWMSEVLEVNPLEELRAYPEVYLGSCTNPLEDPDLLEQLVANGRPDLAVVDGSMYQRCYWVLCHRLGVPYISVTTIDEPWLRRLPALPSVTPFVYTGGFFTEKMTFWERVQNIAILIDWTVWPRFELVEDAVVQRYLPDETYATLAAKSLLWFIDNDVILDYPRPVTPNEVSVGGLTTGPAKPLAEGPLKTFAEMSENKLVVVSFGSYDLAGERFFHRIFNAFRQVSELNFIWRVSIDIPNEISGEDRWPKNILAMKWIPQNDLLGHDNAVLFITHCGANGQFEAVYHGVPMICIPCHADQLYNAARLQYHEYGLNLGRIIHLETDKLVAAIRMVVFNKSFTDNIRLASSIFRSQPMTPRQRAVWWVEHVIQHGAKHLHSYSVDMPWYQYLMLDIICLFVLLPVVVITSAVVASIFWLRGKRHSKDLKNKKQN